MAAKKWDSNKEIDYFREYLLSVPPVNISGLMDSFLKNKS